MSSTCVAAGLAMRCPSSALTAWYGFSLHTRYALSGTDLARMLLLPGGAGENVLLAADAVVPSALSSYAFPTK
eukprot:2241252-Rhodomonas_salina.6